MGTHATWTLDCDQTWCRKEFLAAPVVTQSNSAIRRAARAAGWHAKLAGKTFCPDHRPELIDEGSNGAAVLRGRV